MDKKINIEEELSFEQLILKAMETYANPNTSWADLTKSLDEKEDEFNIEIEKIERLDVEAQHIAQTFYVR